VSRPTPTTGELYADYDRLIRKVEQHLQSSHPRFPGCDDAQVAARIVQRIVEISSDPYLKVALERLPLANPILHVAGLRIDQTRGKVRVSGRQWLRSLFDFASTWGYFLSVLVLAVLCRSRQTSSSATLLLEAPAGYEETDAAFAKFCRQSGITPLASATRLIIAARASPARPAEPVFTYAPRPLVHLVRTCLRRRDQLALLVRHLTAPYAFLRAVLNCSLAVLLGRDAALIPLVRRLDESKLIDALIVTTSSFTSQALWMKGLRAQRFRLHTLWYSQNFIPKMYRGEQQRSDLPSARHIRSDVHWVWTEGFASYLKNLDRSAEVHVVGPILWYVPERVSGLGRERFKVALFDVTPLPDGQTAFGAAKNYYTVSTISKFVSDVVKICDEIQDATGSDVAILLKHKRAPKIGWHAAAYIDLIRDLAETRPGFRLIDHRTNVFGLLQECDLSVSVCYTSTAYVAASLGKPALYYDPYAELVPVFEENKFVHFASGCDELRHLMGRYLKVDLPSRAQSI
jgi:hypothetical protein